MNLNCGEDFMEVPDFEQLFGCTSFHDRTSEETRDCGRKQSGRLPCPSVGGMTKCITGSKRAAHQDRHWL
jgi:hypothetical protein